MQQKKSALDDETTHLYTVIQSCGQKEESTSAHFNGREQPENITYTFQRTDLFCVRDPDRHVLVKLRKRASAVVAMSEYKSNF